MESDHATDGGSSGRRYSAPLGAEERCDDENVDASGALSMFANVTLRTAALKRFEPVLFLAAS
ncbi:hypothetical protein EYF80_051792 [Liparis tanakae]|uniref:Uncharacterized protein n=1 Tax=Liparis tanakae TaxID=230148 RepID=A0A4Z2FAV9_9TELE|nr:hypothetical protein EYF80_051792 [Liparis tanakae]